MKSVKRAMAADFSRQLSERVHVGRRKLMEAGRWSGGGCAYGYARQVFNPDGSKDRILSPGQRKPRADQSVTLVHGPAPEVEAVRLIFSLFVHDLLTLREITVRLNDMGTPYRQAGPWNPSRVRLILQNELATRISVYNRRVSQVGSKVRHTDRVEWKRRAVMKPLVSRVVFEAAQERLGRRNGRHYAREDLIERLRRLYAREGRLSVQLVDDSAETPPMRTYLTHFHTARQAFAQVGYVPPRPPPPDRTEARAAKRQAVLESLGRLLARHGSLSEALIAAEPDLPCTSTLRHWFGSLPDAYALAGYQPQDRLQQVAYWDERRRRAREAGAMGRARFPRRPDQGDVEEAGRSGQTPLAGQRAP